MTVVVSWESLHPQQRELLAEIGIGPTIRAPHEQAWLAEIDAARSYRRCEGKLLALQGHIENGNHLGTWLNKPRRDRRAEKVSAAAVAELEGLGMVWDVLEYRWRELYAQACAFRQENGHLQAPE